MRLDKLRKKIDLFDQKIISLLNLRAAATKAIGKDRKSVV